MKRLLLYSFISLSALSAAAQKTEPLFEIPAGNLIAGTKFLIQSSTGELITGNDAKLMAIDPDTKAMLWENKSLLGIDENDITVLYGTPFIKIEKQKTLSIGNNKNTLIIQARDGKVVYDSKEEGIKVRNTMIIPELKGLMVESVRDGFPSVSLIDFATAKELWTVPLAKEKTGGIGIGALKRAVKSYTSSAFTIAPQTDANGNLILVNKKEIFCISRGGKLAWKKEFDDNVDDAYLGADSKSLFIGYKKYIDKLNTANGNSMISEPIKMKDALNGLTQMGDQYIVFNEAGINIMNADGTMKWKKDASVGNITQVKYTDAGILAIEAVKDDETVFTWVGYDGKDKWHEKVDGGLIMAEPTAKGVMYVTSERANILTFEKGKDVWNKDIKIKGKPFFGIDESHKIIYTYAKDKLHSFNFTDVSYKLVAEDINLKKFNEEEEPAVLDVRNDGGLIVISSNQNVAAVQSADGKVLYNNNFKEIGYSKKKLMRIAGAAATLGGAATTVAGMGNMTVGTPGFLMGDSKQITKGANQIDKGAAIADAGNDLFDYAAKRYLASQRTKDNLYILSQMPEGNGMLVWNKNKGEVSKKITFSDITPQYVVDEAMDRVYVVVGNVIKAYSLK